MQKFDVDDDLVEEIWRLANPRPFENPSFCDALRKVLAICQPQQSSVRQNRALPSADELLAELDTMSQEDLDRLEEAVTDKRRQRSPSPSAEQWASSVPPLHAVHRLTSWKNICDYLEIPVGGDSARRRLAAWVKEHKPEWPAVPDV